MRVELINSEYRLLTFDQVPVHKYFIVEGDDQKKIYLKTQDPGAFQLQDGGCQWIGENSFTRSQLRLITVRAASIEVKKADSAFPNASF